MVYSLYTLIGKYVKRKHAMRKERMNLYITDRQKKQLEKRSQDEDLPMAEIIRRALDIYLAWDDSSYRPDEHTRHGGGSSPA
jgi:hypothetical protein